MKLAEMRAGLQGRPDPARDKADAMLGIVDVKRKGQRPVEIAELFERNPEMLAMKKGGLVKGAEKKMMDAKISKAMKMDKKEDKRMVEKMMHKKDGGKVDCYAAGGVAKIRHEQSTASGAQKPHKCNKKGMTANLG